MLLGRFFLGQRHLCVDLWTRERIRYRRNHDTVFIIIFLADISGCPRDGQTSKTDGMDMTHRDHGSSRGQSSRTGTGGGEQYFVARPASPDQRRTIKVDLADRTCQVEVSHGVFSSGRLDLGTSVLLKRVPQPPTEGDFLDLGCGWGPIARSMAMQSPKANVYAVDTNLRALDLTARNARSQDLDKVRTLTPEQVPDDLRFDLIWSNQDGPARPADDLPAQTEAPGPGLSGGPTQSWCRLPDPLAG